ncbi:macrolide family glycosyltransferase [Streptomyces spiramenti]|uniref:Glycosyl transferase n=1 Tax=Streptomyces spiramenti TaxID=2720606 RepID=A0ABX1AKZ4_9ACTN|nr:macrolide family glycosyltransferase [Streptomyces spiramenti]NJP66499.1 glycosyl transferase [Streptomyces spiramenti]
MLSIPAVSHVYPHLEVIRELVRRGHRVSYANDPRVAELVTGTGAELVPYTSILPESDWPETPIAAMDLFLDEAIQVLPQLGPHFTSDRPDLYLSDIAGAPFRVLAETQGVGLVQLSPASVAWEGYEDEVGAWLRSQPGADAYQRKAKAWLTATGAVTTDPDAFLGRPPRSIAVIPRAMQPDAERVDASRYSFVGACLGARDSADAWQRPEAAEGRRLLLVSLGSAFTDHPDFYRTCLAAFGDLPDWYVVMQIGKQTDPALLGEIPGNVEVHSWVPQPAVLAHADAFVTHAGMGGSKEGLHHGVPMVAVPQATDQFMNADRLVSLGVARRLDSDSVSPAVLRDALMDVAEDPAVRERLVALRAEARREGGTRRAADLVEAELPLSRAADGSVRLADGGRPAI